MNNSNVIRTEKELAQLLQELLGKKDDGFVFRGHADSRWELRPKLFRAQEEIAKSWEDSGLTREYIQKNWFEHVDTLSKLGLCFGNISLKRANYQGVLVLHKGQSIPLIRLLWLYVDIMKYNYNLCQYTSDNRNYYPDQYLENQKDRTPDFWKSFETFLYMLDEVLYLIERRNIYTNELLTKSTIFEDITAYDETHPQHYSVATSALDWTYNPYNALYFAASGLIDSKSSSIITLPYTHIALFSYKQLKHGDTISVMLRSPDKEIKNERAEKQGGLFTWIPMARSFYLLNGYWPGIENYEDLNEETFTLKNMSFSLAPKLLRIFRGN